MVVKWTEFTFYSGDPSLKPAEAVFPINLCLKVNENKQKEGGVGPLKNLQLTNRLNRFMSYFIIE